MSELNQIVSFLESEVGAGVELLEYYEKHPPIIESSVAQTWFTNCAYRDLLRRIRDNDWPVKPPAPESRPAD